MPNSGAVSLVWLQGDLNMEAKHIPFSPPARLTRLDGSYVFTRPATAAISWASCRLHNSLMRRVGISREHPAKQLQQVADASHTGEGPAGQPAHGRFRCLCEELPLLQGVVNGYENRSWRTGDLRGGRPQGFGGRLPPSSFST